MKTQEKILEMTSNLLIKNGYNNLSTYKIANSLSISQGNLRYHFKNKEEIVKVLFDKYMDAYQKIIDNLLLNLNSINLSNLLDAYTSIHELHYEHKYIFVDLTGIVREIPYVKEKLQQIYIQRRDELMTVLIKLVNKGFLKEQPNEYLFRKLIYLQIFITDFWMPHSQIYFDEDLQSEIKYYNEHWIMLIEPYLTKGGYKSINEYITQNPDLVFDQFIDYIKTKLGS